LASNKPVLHANDHLPGAIDALCPNVIDSTENSGNCWGVHSADAADTDVLTSDGAGGSLWAPVNFSLSPDFGLYETSIETISAGGLATLSWQYVSGTALLDLTAPISPSIITRGVYAVMANVAITSGDVLNNDRTITGQLQMGSGDITFADGYMTGDSTGHVISFSMTGVHPMDVTDPISIQINNKDSASRHIQGQRIGVCRIVAY